VCVKSRWLVKLCGHFLRVVKSLYVHIDNFIAAVTRLDLIVTTDYEYHDQTRQSVVDNEVMNALNHLDGEIEM
jgi:hypothetical protein